ncbi:MAG: SH3 domain-containing protein [Chloroflexota bacterium]
MKRIVVALIIILLAMSAYAQDDTTQDPPPAVTEIVTDFQDPPRSNVVLTYEQALGIVPNVDEPVTVLPPQWATDETFALVSVNRANLRTQPSITDGQVVDIAIYGDRYPIIGIFYPGESTVREPETEDFVFDDPNEREVWYLLEINGGAAWIFGGVVLVANPEILDNFLTRNLTPEQQAFIDAQLALFADTVSVRVNSRMRSGPSSDFSQVTIVPSSARVSIIGRNQFSTWFLVDYNGTQGWINFSLLGLPQGFDATTVPIVG